jgi:hypothetical protein
MFVEDFDRNAASLHAIVEPVHGHEEVDGVFESLVVSESDEPAAGRWGERFGKQGSTIEPFCGLQYGLPGSREVDVRAGERVAAKVYSSRSVVLSPEIHRLPADEHDLEIVTESGEDPRGVAVR